LRVIALRFNALALICGAHGLHALALGVEDKAFDDSASGIEALLGVAYRRARAVALLLSHEVAGGIEDAGLQSLLGTPLQHRAAEVVALNVGHAVSGVRSLWRLKGFASAIKPANMPAFSQRATNAIAAVHIASTSFAMNAMLKRRAAQLKMPRPDAYEVLAFSMRSKVSPSSRTVRPPP
jgi:hypothetical protein